MKEHVSYTPNCCCLADQQLLVKLWLYQCVHHTGEGLSTGADELLSGTQIQFTTRDRHSCAAAAQAAVTCGVLHEMRRCRGVTRSLPP